MCVCVFYVLSRKTYILLVRTFWSCGRLREGEVRVVRLRFRLYLRVPYLGFAG